MNRRSFLGGIARAACAAALGTMARAWAPTADIWPRGSAAGLAVRPTLLDICRQMQTDDIMADQRLIALLAQQNEVLPEIRWKVLGPQRHHKRRRSRSQRRKRR